MSRTDPRRAARDVRRLALLALQLACLSLPGLPQQQRQPPAAQPAARDEVRLTVTVTDGQGRPVAGLGAQHFAVSEGKAARAISHFEGGDAPASVALVFDASGSMRDAGLRDARLAAERLVRLGHPRSEYFVADFNHRARVLGGWTSDAAAVSAALHGVGGPRADGRTAFYDACRAALAELKGARHPKRVLVVFSDGQDNASQLSFAQLRQEVRASDVLIYVVAIKHEPFGSLSEETGKMVLAELAVRSGGAAFFPEREAEVAAAAERIAAELRGQYVVGFAPGAGGGGKDRWRKVEIKVTPGGDAKGVRVRSREGYFAPAQNKS